MNNFKIKSSLIALAGLTLLAAGCSNNLTRREPYDPNQSGVSLVQKTCSLCHGLTGESIDPTFPKLAGQQSEYLKSQLAQFKGHDRKDEVATKYMWGFTYLSPSQIEELAAYFSGQKPMQAPANSSVDAKSRGAVVFKDGVPDAGVVACANCHGDAAQGNGQFPRLAGQHQAYLLRQIKVFQTTDDRPLGAPMKVVTHNLNDADATAVAGYIASLGTRP